MIEQVFTLISTCDTCGKRSEPYPAPKRTDVAPGWVESNKWSPSFSTLIRRQYCSKECDLLEQHGFKKQGAQGS